MRTEALQNFLVGRLGVVRGLCCFWEGGACCTGNETRLIEKPSPTRMQGCGVLCKQEPDFDAGLLPTGGSVFMLRCR